MQSLWSDTTERLPSFGSFFDYQEERNKEIYSSQQQENEAYDIKTDVLIIGGGLAGILCAYELHQNGIDYILVEADTIGNGMTKDTTAKITSQHRLIYGRIMEEFGLEKAKMYYNANENALEKYRQICAGIDCDFEEKDSYVYSVHDPHKLLLELEAMEKIGYPAELVEHVPLSVENVGAVRFRNQAQFHPLKFIAAIAKELCIFEHTKVIELAPHLAKTNHGVVHAEQIIIATHYPMLNKHGAYFLKMYQSRSYVIAYSCQQANTVQGNEGAIFNEEREEPGGNCLQVDGMYVDEADTGYSFRNYKDMLLIGGSGKRTGKKSGKWEQISIFAAKNYPKAQERYRWAAQDCITLDGIPYIGAYAKNTSGLLVATGFNKWGMTSAMAAAEILTDQILGRENPNASVFDPQRTMVRKQLFINGAEATKNLLTPSMERCPHMGCALKWNPEERSWDCPCHGSRFEEDGTLINNPAVDDRKVKGDSKNEN